MRPELAVPDEGLGEKSAVFSFFCFLRRESRLRGRGRGRVFSSSPLCVFPSLFLPPPLVRKETRETARQGLRSSSGARASLDSKKKAHTMSVGSIIRSSPLAEFVYCIGPSHLRLVHLVLTCVRREVFWEEKRKKKRKETRVSTNFGEVERRKNN